MEVADIDYLFLIENNGSGSFQLQCYNVVLVSSWLDRERHSKAGIQHGVNQTSEFLQQIQMYFFDFVNGISLIL